MTPRKPVAPLALACAAALAVSTLPVQAVVTENETGPASFLVDDFNGAASQAAFDTAGFSFFSGQGVTYHGNDTDGFVRADGPLSLTFNAETALSSLTLSFWYTGCNYLGTNNCTSVPSLATVSLTGPGNNSLLSTDLASASGINPGPTGGGSIGSQFVTSFSNLVAGDYTLRFAPVGGSVIFKLDDVSLTAVSAVPEPAGLALMLAGLGVVGFAARRRKA